jgi:hypothetical protein
MNLKEITSLLKLSTQPKDHTKAHDKMVHPQAQHKDDLSHSNASSSMKALKIVRSYKRGFLTLSSETLEAKTCA